MIWARYQPFGSGKRIAHSTPFGDITYVKEEISNEILVCRRGSHPSYYGPGLDFAGASTVKQECVYEKL
jgi:hypothetical protein